MKLLQSILYFILETEAEVRDLDLEIRTSFLPLKIIQNLFFDNPELFVRAL